MLEKPLRLGVTRKPAVHLAQNDREGLAIAGRIPFIQALEKRFLSVTYLLTGYQRDASVPSINMLEIWLGLRFKNDGGNI